MLSSRLFPQTLAIHLTSLAFLSAASGCGQATTDGAAEAYIENGVLWAYGSVQLADLDGPGRVVLKRRSGDQAFDNGNDASRWSLVGAMLADDERDLAYVDLHPAHDRLLAYSYQIDVVRRASYGEKFDVFGVLKRYGRSYHQRQRVFLGTAAFDGGDDAPLVLAEDLKLSLIANGVFAGQWALHYPDVRKVVVRPWQGMCSKSPTQSPGQGPGQNPGQNPGQFDMCRPLPPAKDLCGGDPTQAACRPRPPVQQPATGGGQPLPSRQVAGLEPQGNEVYVMSAEVKEAKLVFVSTSITAADAEANAALCARKFFAVARSIDGRVNQACVLTPAPASVEPGGAAACGLTVRFELAQTYLERICDVTVVFKGGDTQKVQILKR